MYDAEIQEISKKLEIINKMYQIIRFVDPVEKKIYKTISKELSDYKTRCYEFWENGTICQNCISIRAFNENKTFIKIEFNMDKIYTVMAIPIDISGKRIVAEIINDHTDSFILDNYGDNDNTEVHLMIKNLNKLTLIDPLTNVYNKRYINERLPIDIIKASLFKQNITLILTDIDFFKLVNDHYGHLLGDEVLKTFGSTINQCLTRSTDWISRFGGDEFLICLPDVEKDEAIEIAERMRKAIESLEIKHEEVTIKITASFGVYTIIPEQDCKTETILKCADKKLYIAKSNGRNRVEF